MGTEKSPETCPGESLETPTRTNPGTVTQRSPERVTVTSLETAIVINQGMVTVISQGSTPTNPETVILTNPGTETPERQYTETISLGTVTVTSPEIWTLGGARVGGYPIMGEQGDPLTLPLRLTVPQGGVCQIRGEQGGPPTTLHHRPGGTLKTLRTAINPLTTRMKAREEATFLEISTPSNPRHYFRGKEV